MQIKQKTKDFIAKHPTGSLKSVHMTEWFIRIITTIGFISWFVFIFTENTRFSPIHIISEALSGLGVGAMFGACVASWGREERWYERMRQLDKLSEQYEEDIKILTEYKKRTN